MRKHFLLLMLMALLPMVGFADELVGSTQYTNDGYQYKIKTINTTAKTGTVSVRSTNWTVGNADATKITIQNTITLNVKGEVSSTPFEGVVVFDVVEIEADGFKDLSDVTSIEFATGCNITTIGGGAFAGTSIEKLDLTNTQLETLEKVFEDANTSLKSVILPATLTEVAANGLAHCYALSSIDATKAVLLKTLGANCFGDNVVTNLDLSKTIVDDLSTTPFVGKTGESGEKNKTLTTLTLPATVKTLGTGLANLYNLTSVNLEATIITDVADLAFENDKSLTALTFPATLKTIKTATADKEVFRGCAKLAALTFYYDVLTTVGDGTNALFAEATAGDGTLAALTTLKFIKIATVDPTFKATIDKASFANCTSITTVEIADGNEIASSAVLKEGAITLSSVENSTVKLGKLAAAPVKGFIAGPTTTGVEATVTFGDITGAQAQATAIISGNIGNFTVGKLSAALCVEAIGAASKIVFGGDITTALTVAGSRVVNSRLTEIDFGKIAISASMFPEAAFDEVNAPNLVKATWAPTTATKAFDVKTFGTAEKNASAMVKFTTTEAVAALYPKNVNTPSIKDEDLYNVVFVFDATVTDDAKAIKVYGPAGGSAFIGYFKAEAGKNYKIAKNQTNEDKQTATITVYSAFIDESDNKCYMDPLQIVNGAFVVEKNQVVVIRSSMSDDVKAYETTDANTMRYNIASKLINDLMFTDVAISADELGTKYYDKGQFVYYLSNPSTTGAIKWTILGSNYYLPKNSVYTVRNGQAASAPELEIVWLDGSENVTGIIERISNEKAASNGNNAIYNLAGQKVDAAYKGIVIVNGKKMIKK